METAPEPPEAAPAVSAIDHAEDRVARARRALSSRIEELGRRVDRAKDTFDVRAQITKHVWPSIGIAVGLGALLGLVGHPRQHTTGDRTLGATVLASAGALGWKLLRTYALGQLADSARSWIDERDPTGLATTATTRDHEPERDES
ncbi:MAG: hypothetical protein IPQ07_09935 [Myxococcales bacterium]|nr:hypothetical protein [Myxococcales bacterium]